MNSQGAPQPEMPTELLAAIDPILGYLNYGKDHSMLAFFEISMPLSDCSRPLNLIAKPSIKLVQVI